MTIKKKKTAKKTAKKAVVKIKSKGIKAKEIKAKTQKEIDRDIQEVIEYSDREDMIDDLLHMNNTFNELHIPGDQASVDKANAGIDSTFSLAEILDIDLFEEVCNRGFGVLYDAAGVIAGEQLCDECLDHPDETVSAEIARLEKTDPGVNSPEISDTQIKPPAETIAN